MAGWDDVSSAAPDAPAPNAWDAVSSATPDESTHPFLNHFVSTLGAGIAHSVVKNIAETGEAPSLFGFAKQVPKMFEAGTETAIKSGAQLESNIIAPALSAEQRTSLENAGLYNLAHVAADKIRNSGMPLTGENYKNLIADGIIQSPVGQFAGAAYSTLMAPVAPLFDVATKTAEAAGASPGDINLATAGLTILGVAHAGGAIGKTAEGLEHHVIGASESTFMGLTEPHPVMNEVAHKAAEVNAPAEPEAVAPAAEPFDANKIARNIAPDVFSEYDALTTRRDSYFNFLDDLRNKQREEVTANAPHNAEIAELQAKMENANARQSKIYQKQIDVFTEKNDTYIDEQLHPLNASEDIKTLRSQLADITKRIGDLAPDVKAAYREADNYRSAETEQPPAKESVKAEPENEQPQAEEPKPIVQETTPSENTIAGPLSEHLQSLGRPKDEADASAALMAAHYQALSDLGWVKGTPEEIYQKYKPEIVKGEAKKARKIVELSQRSGKELKQGGTRGSYILPFGEFKGGVIGLRPTADASTLVHELGHAWLEEMRGFAAEPDAPKSLLDAHKVVSDWLKAKDGESLSRKQHEQFARGFERYLMEGVAPSKGLAKVFAQFKDWLTKIYQTVNKLRSPVTDEVRGVFDQLLAANPEKTVIAPDIESTPVPEAKVDEKTANSASEGGKTQVQEAETIVKAPEEPSAVANPGKSITTQELGESLIDKAGNIRVDLLTKKEDIIDLIHQMADENGGYQTAQGDAITQRDISDFAASLGIEEAKINIEKLQEITRADGIPLAFRIRAARVTLKQTTQAIQDLMKSAEQWGEEDAIKYAEAKATHVLAAKTLSGATAEWGRAGHAFRDISTDKDAKAAQDITELLQSATGRTFEELKREAMLGRRLQNSKQAAKYITASTKPTFVEKMLWYRNNCLLSGPVTHGVYLEANVVNLALRPLETAVAAQLGKVSGATEGAVPGEATAMMYGLANLNAFRNAADSWREHIAVLPGNAGMKYTSLAFNQQLIEGPLGTALHQVSRSVNVLHSFVYTMAYEQNIAAASYRTAFREGLTPGTDAFAKRLADLRADQPPEMMDDATKLAFDEVNMGRSGPVLGKLSLFLNSNALTRFMFPFVKMEINVLKNTWLERTPLGLLSKDIRANLLGVNGEAARDMQRAKVLFTTGLAGTLFTLGSQYVNADGPADPDKNRVWRLTHTPNSIQIGDTAFSLKGLGRVGALLRFGAGMKESLDGWEGDDAEHIGKGLLEHVSHNFDSSFTEGIKNTIDLTSNFGEKGSQFIQNFATQFLPFSVGLGQIAHVTDPFLRDTKTEGEKGPLASAEGILKAAAARVPGASWLLDAKYDMFGQPIARSSDYHDQYKDDPVVQRMNALHMSVGRLDPKIFAVPLDSEQYAEYSRQSGILTKETLDRVVSPQFAQLPLTVQVESIHKAITACREQARQMIIAKYPDIRDKAIEFQRLAHTPSQTAP